MQMSRESRKILDELNTLANNDGVQGIIVPAHIFICDLLVFKFYTPPIISILKSKIKSCKNKAWKHYTIDYWASTIESMLSHNSSARRDTSNITYEYKPSFYTIIRYLIVDYSITDIEKICNIINTCSDEEIIDACMTAKKMNVYDIAYIDAILNKNKAYKQVTVNNIQELNDKIEKSNTLLGRETHSHTILELAMMEYNYKKAKENNELERKFNEMMGDMSDTKRKSI